MWNDEKSRSGLFVRVGVTLSRVLKETEQRLIDRQTDRQTDHVA